MNTLSPRVIAAIARIEGLVPAPRTLARALALVRDPRTDIADIAELVSRDPALAGDVLRVANSAYFAPGSPVATVGEAVQRIGLRETVRLLNLVTARCMAAQGLGNYGIGAEEFWAESLFNGLFMESLASWTGAFDPGEAYTTGLMRFIGRLAVNQMVESAGAGLFWNPAAPVQGWELDNAGVTQAGLGAQLLQRWRFPDTIVRAVAHQDDAGPADPSDPLAQATQFTALLLPAGLEAGAIEALGRTPPQPPVAHPFTAAHRLADGALPVLVTDSLAKFHTVLEGLPGRASRDHRLP